MKLQLLVHGKWQKMYKMYGLVCQNDHCSTFHGYLQPRTQHCCCWQLHSQQLSLSRTVCSRCAVMRMVSSSYGGTPCPPHMWVLSLGFAEMAEFSGSAGLAKDVPWVLFVCSIPSSHCWVLLYAGAKTPIQQLCHHLRGHFHEYGGTADHGVTWLCSQFKLCSIVSWSVPWSRKFLLISVFSQVLDSSLIACAESTWISQDDPRQTPCVCWDAGTAGDTTGSSSACELLSHNDFFDESDWVKANNRFLVLR